MMMLLPSLVLSAGTDAVERVYISTDRDCYVAGEDILCSAFCIDLNAGGCLSDCSRVAYLELVSTDGTAQKAKIALNGGRGGGLVTIPASTPTGNYLLVAYTAQNLREEGYDYLSCSRVVSIFNTFSNERVASGVRVVEKEDYRALQEAVVQPESDGRFEIRVDRMGAAGGSAQISLVSHCELPASLSVSIRHDDGIIPPRPFGIGGFAASAFRPGRLRPGLSETEGEIIRGKVVGADLASYDPSDLHAIIGTYGDKSDTYASGVAADGTVVFFTNNIYGTCRNLFTEIDGLEKGADCHVELEDGFAGAKVDSLPQLTICSTMYEKLVERSVSMQMERSFNADTLRPLLPKRPGALFNDDECERFILDDYVRFDSVRDVIVEILSGVRFRHSRRHGTRISVLMDDVRSPYSVGWGESLLLLDGVPVPDYDIMLGYDPDLVREVEVYRRTYNFGSVNYAGVVNFVTYQGNMPGIVLDDSVRIVDWRGVSYPVAVGRRFETMDDLRRTLWWHPAVTVEAGESFTLECLLPDYEGRFEMVVEGVDASGRTIYEKKTIKF